MGVRAQKSSGVLTAYQAGTNGGLNGERVYQFMDHLGSIEVLTDQNATVIQGNSFDAWGARRQYNGVAMINWRKWLRIPAKPGAALPATNR